MLTFELKTENLNLEERVKELATKAELILAAQVMADTEKYVPALTGSLAQRTHLEGKEIVYPGPYARFLYYGKVMIYEPTKSTWAPRYGHKVVTDRDLQFNKSMHPNATSHWFEVSKAANLEKWERVAERAMENA